jgi:hypothetical protein
MNKEEVDKILELLGVTQEELKALQKKSKKVTVTKKKVVIPPAYVIKVVITCTLCRDKEVKIFHMKPCEEKEALVSEEVKEIPKNLPLTTQTKIVKSCSKCFDYLMGLEKPSLVLMYLQTKNVREENVSF